jgi:hypothetical protein
MAEEQPVLHAQAGRAARLQPGQVLAGFEIIEELNRGGMGVIYKARQQGLNRVVALKVISPDRLGHPSVLHRFRREVQAAALLSHPNIVTVFHTDLNGPWPYLAMEFVPGIDLFRLVNQAGRLSIEDACTYIRQAAQGLQHAFEQGMVHRDIKPANLMVSPSPLEAAASRRPLLVKILDMGLARVTAPGESADSGSSLTQAGEFLGTPDYIAPEQAEDSRTADIRSDLYSLGGSLYFLLTGEVPYPGTNMVQKLRRQITEPPPSAAARRPEVPAALDSLVRKLMAATPADRYQTPAELIDALDAFLRQPDAARISGTAGQPAAAQPGPAATGKAAQAPSDHGTARSIDAHRGGVTALCVSSDGGTLLSGGLDETIRAWDAVRLREVRCIAGDVGPVQGLCLAPGGKWAASCSLRVLRQDMVVQLWDLASGKERRRLRGAGARILCVAVAPDGRQVAAGTGDHAVRIWALEKPAAPPLTLKGHTDVVASVLFLPGGDSLISGGHDGMLRQWDAKTGTARASLNGQVGPIAAVALGGASKRIAVGGAGLAIRQANGAFTALHGHHGPVSSLAFLADGQLLLSGGADGTVRLWQPANGEQLCCLEGHTGKVHAVAFSADGRAAFSAGADGTIRCWPLLG